MNEPIYISRDKPAQPGMDYEALRQEAIRLIPQFASAYWTDYNVHDPGITILENLCYGITDLGYRINFKIQELLFAKDSAHPEPVQNAFYEPQDILPGAALTVNDYRKLIIDRIKEVQNAWVTPLKEQGENFKGLYSIMIQIDDEVNTRTNEAIKTEVRNLFCAHRNLCEDLESVLILDQIQLEISAKIELENDASVESVLADILHQMEHLIPDIHSSTMEQMQADGIPIQEILEGPKPVYNLIKNEDLVQLPPVIYVSEIKDIIAAVNGVNVVENVKIRVDGGPEMIGSYNLNNSYPVLSPKMKGEEGKYPLVFYRNGRPVEPNLSLAMQMLKGFATKEHAHYDRGLDFSKPQPETDKKLKDIGAYFSMQHFFPAVYGIGAYGLPREADTLRHAQARQLKGYLAIMEFLLADYLEQLTQVKHYFSIENKAHQWPLSREINAERLGKLLNDIPDFDPLINKAATSSPLEQEKRTTRLDSSLETRHRFIDHLLARFAETIDESLFCHKLSDRENPQALRLADLEAKCRILREYVDLSQNRGLGLNYRSPNLVATVTDDWGEHWACNQVSGFKKRICRYLNISRCEDRALTAFFPFEPYKLEQLPAKSSQQTPAVKRLKFKTLLKFGVDQSNYTVRKKSEKTLVPRWEVIFKTQDAKEGHTLYESTKGLEDAKAYRDQFIKQLIAFDKACEGFFIVEHLLLRPQLTDNIQLKLSIKKNGIDAEFVSIGFGAKDKMQRIAEKILLTAANLGNYEVLKDGQFYFPVLKLEQKPILVSTRKYRQAEADLLCKQLADLCSETMKNAPGEMNRWLEQTTVPVNGLNVDHAFYAHRLSVVLPNWPVSFMEKEAQLAIEHLVTLHVPAHKKVDFHWLSWPDLQKFETDYKNWLEAKNQETTDNKTLNDLSFTLIKQLAPDELGLSNLKTIEMRSNYAQWLRATQQPEFTNDATLIDLSFKLLESLAKNKVGDPDTYNWVPEYGFKTSDITDLYNRWVKYQQEYMVDLKKMSAFVFELAKILAPDKIENSVLIQPVQESGLKSSQIQALLSEFPYLLLEPEDLQAIEGIDADIAQQLNTARIYTWMDLSRINAKGLSKQFKNLNFIEKDLESWIKQAALLVTADETNKWEKIAQQQRLLLGKDKAPTALLKIQLVAEQKKNAMYFT
jgi:hypothetical protein